MKENAIETDRLRRDFGTVRAVDDVSIGVPRGCVFGFLGPNGAGKTTTIRLLLGLLEPSAGAARVLGFDTRTHATEIRARCGALLEHHGLYERLSAQDNLEFHGRIWKLPTSERQGRIRELLGHFGLWERRKEAVGTWSKGMKQKLAIARATLHRPAVLFLDEPTAGLDPTSAAALRQDIATLAEGEGVTVFLTTHNLNEAERLCSLVALIRRGRLVAQGHPTQLRGDSTERRAQIWGSRFSPAIQQQLRQRPEIELVEARNGCLELQLGEDADVGRIVSEIVAAGAYVEEVRRPQATLEEVFLSLMEEDETCSKIS